jgi:hypothetical protein
MSDQQLDIFGATAAAPTNDQLLGVLVRLPDACGKCGGDVAVIGAGKGVHKASIACNSCGYFRGWVSYESYKFIAEITNKFGAPTTPILIRRRSERAPPTSPDQIGGD